MLTHPTAALSKRARAAVLEIVAASLRAESKPVAQLEDLTGE